MDWRRILLYVWLAGAALIFARYLIGTVMMMRIANRGRRIDDGEWLSLAQRTASQMGITRPLTMLWGDKLSVPITWGVLYPVILLPESAQEWPIERRRFVLVHEIAHVKRFDALTQLFAQLTLAVFWFSPLVWLAEWKLRIEREHACDDAVLEHGTEPTLYADELLQMVRSLVQRRTPAPAFAALAMARKSEFEGRMIAILDPARRRSVSGLWSGAMFALLSLVIAAPVAAIDPFAVNVVTSQKPGPGESQQDTGRVAHQAREAKVAHLAGEAKPECDFTSSSTSTHVHDESDRPNDTRISIKLSRPGRCISADIAGQVVLSEGEHSVREMGTNSYVRLREITPKLDFAARIEHTPAGEMLTSFLVDGRATADNGVGQRWIARILPEVMRESGANADKRISGMLGAHGLIGTLGTIAAIQSPASRGTHYIALIQARRWSKAELDRIGRAATRSLADAPSDLTRVLNALPQQNSSSIDLELLEQVWRGMSSESDLRGILTAQLPNADRPMLVMMAGVVVDFESGYNASSFLMAAAPYYLTRRDAALEDAWFAAASGLSSSYDRRNALLTAIKFANGNEPVKAGILKSAAGMSSDSDKTFVLTALATTH